MMLVTESTKDSQRFSQRLTLFRGWEFDRGSDQSFAHSTVMGKSCSGHGAAHSGWGLQVKVKLPTVKDEKMKDAVTYHSWWWEMAIFHCSGWDNQHLQL